MGLNCFLQVTEYVNTDNKCRYAVDEIGLFLKFISILSQIHIQERFHEKQVN